MANSPVSNRSAHLVIGAGLALTGFSLPYLSPFGCNSEKLPKLTRADGAQAFRDWVPGTELTAYAPDLKVSGWYNTTKNLSRRELLSAGLVVAEVYWAPWCGPCVAEIPAINQLQHRFRDKVVFLSLAVEQDQKVLDFVYSNASFDAASSFDTVVGAVGTEAFRKLGSIPQIRVFSGNAEQPDYVWGADKGLPQLEKVVEQLAFQPSGPHAHSLGSIFARGAVAESERFARTTIDTVPETICVLDKTGVIQGMSGSPSLPTQ